MNNRMIWIAVAKRVSFLGNRILWTSKTTAGRLTNRLLKPDNSRQFMPRRMLIPLLLFVMIGRAAAEDPGQSVLVQALKDELNRTMAELQINNQDRPYYCAYRVTDGQIYKIKAMFGSLISSAGRRERHLYVDLRVGSNALDNSNFLCDAAGPATLEADHTLLPLDDDYYALRQAIWLVTDGTYKKALERLSRKKAFIQNQPLKDSVPDFISAPVAVTAEPGREIIFDPAEWETRLLELSKIFQRFPELDESNVTMRMSSGQRYFLDSEGNQSRVNDHLAAIEVSVKTRAEDGDPLEDLVGFYAPSVEGLPDLETMRQAVTAAAETLSLLARAKKDEGYSGPVLFMGQAAAELMFQLLGKGVSDPRPPLKENDAVARNANLDNLGQLSGRLGRKVLPTFISVYDDPAIERWQGIDLIGHYRIDDQGVRSQRVDLVQSGKLTGLFMSRAPVKKIMTTNGHARFRNETYGGRCCGLPGVMVMESDVTFSRDELMKRLTSLAADYGNQQALVITRLTPARPKTESEQYRRWFAAAGNKDQPLLSAPAFAYRVNLNTGQTELIRGLEFSSVTTRLLRDILAAGAEPYVYNFVYYDAEGNDLPVSVIAPILLIEEMDLVAKESKPTKPPVLPHPFFKKR